MDSFDSYLDKAYEELNEAIMKAIVSSEDVRAVLTNFKEKDMISNLAVLNLILSLEELSDLVFGKNQNKYKFESVEGNESEPRRFEATPPSQERPESSPHHMVDGKRLTEKEILFEQFCQGNFDMEKWLKKARIKL